jgi:tetratricopeptide (TPR) repeat protein
MSNLNIELIKVSSLEQEAKFLFERKKYKESAQLLSRFLKEQKNPVILNNIYMNLRMCYFFANDVPNALNILEKQEELPIQHEWTIKRDKANYLRYMNRHDEAYEVVKTIEDEKTRYLAWSWFEHKNGNVRAAFELIEKSRKNHVYWLFKLPDYKYTFWNGQHVENLVVLAESGFGDQIIFSRWLPLLKTLCQNVYYDGKALSPTFCRVFNIKDISSWKETKSIHAVPIMSLAYHLSVEKPDPIKYLNCELNIKKRYDEEFPKKQLRIGLCVQGDKTHVETNLRTLPLKETVDHLIKFGEVVNLEKDVIEKDSRVKYIPFETWEDTLALLDTCDIIVTCDTGVSHAAASMGKTTIVLMHAAAYFTWNHNEDMSKTIWYENAWCIHQDLPCDWKGSLNKCEQLISDLIEKEKI